nr:hypothetical protein [Tanacetum cinerariifolium]
QTDEPNLSATTTIVEVPKELPKVSMELFTSFKQCLIDEVTEVQNVFKQMELAVEQHREEKNIFQNKLENVLQENDRLLTQALSVEIVNVVVHDNVKSACLDVDVCAHCKNTLSSSGSALTFAEFFEINELKAQTQEKDTVILKLKEKLHVLNGDMNERNTYKQLYDSIKSSRVRLKEQCDDLINKVNLKSAEVSDLNASLQEKVLVDVTPLVPKLRKNRIAHTDYIRHTQEEAATLREIVESERLLSPLNTSLDFALKRKVWKPTGNVFKTVGHIWKLTGQTFTLVGNVCPLTRIATPTIVRPREPIPIVNRTDKPVVTLVYTRKPKAANKKVPNKLKPSNSWGSSSSNVPSSLLSCRLSKSSSDMIASSPICLLSKASKTKSWLWHRRLSHLNFRAINHLARQGLVRGLLKLKFEKDHLCSTCAMGKSTKKTHKPKSEDTNQEKIYLLHMDLCGPMHNGTEFVNQTLCDYYEEVGISHETSVVRSPQQNGVVERRNHTLIEAARTMLIYAQAPLFLWAEAVATACFTQNRSIIRLRYGKTLYELLHSKLPDLSFFHSSSGPDLNDMTPGTISSRLVCTSSSLTSYVPPIRND